MNKLQLTFKTTFCYITLQFYCGMLMASPFCHNNNNNNNNIKIK